MAAAAQGPRTGEKRPGRTAKINLTPAAKKLKTTAWAASAATPTPDAAPTPPPPAASPAERRGGRLPIRVTNNKPIPALPEPQSSALPSDDYQSVAASAVLAASLERSRARWTCQGVFQKYWVKPESGKNAKPPPIDNPDVKWMKAKGECRIRLEPHVFTADVYVEERPKAAPPKQHAAYGQQYRSQLAQPLLQQLPPSRPLQPCGHPSTPQPTLAQLPLAQRLASSPSVLQPQDKKASPDPVISMLASRASSNPELKSLMKEVATGEATQDQLRVFQEHIDELTEIIKKQKKDEEEQAANTNQNDRNPDSKPPPPAPQPAQQHAIPQPTPYHAPQQQPPPLYQSHQPGWTQASSTRLPVILAFRDPGSGEDRFLFPQMSILEPLSPQHELVSFIVVKKGREASDRVGLEPDQEYWQPVTMMVEVAYGREEILSCIRKWVKPADEVRKHMESIMEHSQRAPPAHLAFRLPYISTQPESEEASKEATPIVEEKAKPKSTVKYVKKLATSDSSTPLSTASKKAGDISSAGTPKNIVTPTPAPSEPKGAAVPAGKDDAVDLGTGTAEGRPRRTLRKSVRIEG